MLSIVGSRTGPVAVPAPRVQVDGRPSRREYTARVEAALAAGDVAALPVLLSLAKVPVEELCGDCHGKGICRDGDEADGLPPGYGICFCILNPYAAWWDFTRAAATHKRVWGLDTVWTYRACGGCDTVPVTIDPATAVMPWRPDCAGCGDTGWELAEVGPLCVRPGWEYAEWS